MQIPGSFIAVRFVCHLQEWKCFPRRQEKNSPAAMYRWHGWAHAVVLRFSKHATWRQVSDWLWGVLIELTNCTFQLRHNFLDASLCRNFLASFPRRALRTFQHIHNRSDIAGNRFYCETPIAVWRRKFARWCRKIGLLLGPHRRHRKCRFHRQCYDSDSCAPWPASFSGDLQFRTVCMRVYFLGAADDQRILSTFVWKSISRPRSGNLQLFGSNLADDFASTGRGRSNFNHALHHNRLRLHLAGDFLQSNPLLLFDFRCASYRGFSRAQRSEKMGAYQRNERLERPGENLEIVNVKVQNLFLISHKRRLKASQILVLISTPDSAISRKLLV